ncbi:MAG: MFS transporter [Candidatus Thorarchaeota archaeon]|nr:MFS transporter [Candidatus Thorarchaeota archaeon]
MRTIFSNKNYTVFLTTSWVYSTFNYMSSYFNLYLRSLGWDVLLIGVVLSISAGFSGIFRLIGGYMGDVVDRKKISFFAYLTLALYFLAIGIFFEFWVVIAAILAISIHDLFRSGSSAYLMDNVPKEHSGFALSLFTAGRGLSIISLIVFGFIEPMIGFSEAFRAMYIMTGFCVLVASGARAYFLDSSVQLQKRTDRGLISEFFSQNRKAAVLLITAIPGLISVVVLDTISDSLFKTVALIYANEELSIDIAGINLILMFQLLISVPLLLKMGRITDRKGVKKAAIVVYSVMPISAALLFFAPLFPYMIPAGFVLAFDTYAPGLSVIFSTAFVGIVMKYLNDALWWGLIVILIRKRLPQTDTAKVLSIFWVIVYILSSVGPAIAGFIYTFLNPQSTFLTVFVLNILILISVAKGPFGNNNSEQQQEIEPQEQD